MSKSNVRVRFAPSPTGEPHVGNIRSALFNWLFARRHGGTFIVRLEDTDQARKVEGAEHAIYESLRWLGLDWDEGPEVGGPSGPYVQSERVSLYGAVAERLVEEGRAYRCYCTPEELAEMRKEQQRRGEPPRYDRRCRYLSDEERVARADMPSVVRFMTPTQGDPIVVPDLIRGEVSFDVSLLDDFVLLKSDGFPTYHLANVVDDNAMRISHVLRAEEWLSSAPRHLLLYDALGCEPPLLGHLPIILGPDRSKLSKRHGATALLDYKRGGFLPEAMLNFLVLLGWSLDDRTEIIRRDELIRHFSIERVSRSPAIFDMDKLRWMNGVYIRRLTQEDLAHRMAGVLASYVDENRIGVSVRPTQENLLPLVPLVQERITFLKAETDDPKRPGLWDLTCFFLTQMPDYEVSPVPKRMDARSTHHALFEASKALDAAPAFDAGTIEDILRPLADELGMRTRDLFGAIRIAVTGKTAAPPLFDTLAVVGKERVLARLRYAIGLVGQHV